MYPGELGELTSGQDKIIQTGIPPEAFELECPEPEFKAAVLQEFILLDQKYVDRLDGLEAQHMTALRYVLPTECVIYNSFQ